MELGQAAPLTVKPRVPAPPSSPLYQEMGHWWHPGVALRGRRDPMGGCLGDARTGDRPLLWPAACRVLATQGWPQSLGASRGTRDAPLQPCFIGRLPWPGLEKCPLTAGRRGTPGNSQAGSSRHSSAPASSSPSSSSPRCVPRPCRNCRAQAGRGGNYSRAAAGLITGQWRGAGSALWEEARRRVSSR